MNVLVLDIMFLWWPRDAFRIRIIRFSKTDSQNGFTVKTDSQIGFVVKSVHVYSESVFDFANQFLMAN